jgi:hypothetical protein
LVKTVAVGALLLLQKPDVPELDLVAVALQVDGAGGAASGET